jgi:nucleoid-associated protein YgaU
MTKSLAALWLGVRIVDRKKKIGLAVLIIVVGVALALQFRHADRTVADGAAAPIAGATTESSFNRTLLDNGSKSGAALSGEVSSLIDDMLPKTTPLGPSADATKFNGRSQAPTQALADLNEPDKIHKVIDGDTLPKLAQRYWGRGDRYADLYAYNRDVLTDPDVLPIGAELRIPAHLIAAIGGDQASAAPLLPLAPLPQAAPTPSSAVTAAAQKQPAQRTYQVRTGDNLIDIARKLYGDGRKHTELFEANRRIMRSPTDLRPGMLLVVP